jgi:hypothetical protein
MRYRTPVHAVALTLWGCGKPAVVDFPSELAPLEENKAAWPSPTEDAEFPETLSVVSGGDDTLWWAHARGYVGAPADEVWQHLRDPDADVDRREVDEWEVVDGTVPRFDDSYTIRCVVHDLLTIEYDLTWVHELQEGTEAAPERVVAQWDKTDGTSFIDLLAGSLVLEPEGDEVTRLEYVEHLDAALRDDETIAQYLSDLHASIVALSHGEPLPVWP